MPALKAVKTLHEFLKPPFNHDTIGMIYDGNSRLIEVPGININKEGLEALAKTRGWGCFQYYENGVELQDAFMNFIVEALNEKCRREGIL